MMFVRRFNLPFLFCFINCPHSASAAPFRYCCRPLAVCLGQLRLILSGEDWTPQMSAYNLLIPFISVLPLLVRACESVRVRTCLPVQAAGCACLERQEGTGRLCVDVCVYMRVENESPHLVYSLEGRARSPFHFCFYKSHVCLLHSVVVVYLLLCLFLGCHCTTQGYVIKLRYCGYPE